MKQIFKILLKTDTDLYMNIIRINEYINKCCQMDQNLFLCDFEDYVHVLFHL